MSMNDPSILSFIIGRGEGQVAACLLQQVSITLSS
uniref:Uncharacterized protein n=1 Tax=Rhizophora mucronata TaxID=61149 RepID=A0A2P2PN71_RHIMU